MNDFIHQTKRQTKGTNTFMTLMVLSLAILNLATIAQPQAAEAQSITPDHIAKMQSVSNAILSPDGSAIAYTVSVPADPYESNSSASSHLYVMDTETGEAKPYYTVGSVGSVQFRPGHEAITFLASRSGDNGRALYELPLDGGEAVKIYSYERSISGYQWNSDGSHIVFTSSEPAETSSSPLPYKADVYEENQTFRRAYIVNVTEADANAMRINAEGMVHMTEWSPSGDRLAITTTPTPNIDDFYMYQKVKVVDAQSGDVIAEVNNAGKIGQIVWSPNGEKLAIRAGKDIHDPTDGRILTVSASGGTPEMIDGSFEGKYEQIAWTDDNEITFLASESTSGVIGTIAPDGSSKEVFVRGDAMAIGGMSYGSGLIAITASTPAHPSELFLIEDGGSPERKTFHNDWLEEVELGKQEVVTYKTRDGMFDIDGMLIYPVGYEEGTRYPVITVVHGGPEAHYSNGWLTAYSMPGQMAAGKGYAVFYPNYRGSTGRGTEFAYSSQADLSGKEFDDVVDGVDYLISAGIADAERIGVTGGSYGGYASAWMSTYYSDRFAAAVMFVGISNNLSKWGTSDIPDELYLVHSRERMWDSDDKWMDYLRRSPIYWVDRAQTPILIMHGAEDTRVHPAQSLELYRHLKVRKPEVPVRLVFYPGEGHGNRGAASRYDYNVRMLEWFDTYLMTGDAGAEMPHWDAPVPVKN